jgi:hypothetical protein
MKKSLVFALLLAPLLLASCGTNTSKAVTSLSDFLTVADASAIKIAGTSLKTASGSSSTAETESSKGNAGASSAGNEAISSHSANLYLNEDFTITDETSNYIGFSRAYSSITQYFLINGARKSGFVSDDATTLDAERAATKNLIAKDYSDVQKAYDLMKSYAGKSASDFSNMTYLSLAMGVEGDTAGYTLITITQEGSSTSDSRYYLTMDKFDDQWVFTNYSKRVTTTVKTSKDTITNYAVVEYAIDVVSEYSAFSLALSSYTLYLKDHSAADVTFPNGIPLTAA